MTSRMAAVYISGKMESGMKVSGRMASFTEKESRLCLMELYSMEIGRKVDLSDKACASIQMERSTRGAGSTVNLMELVSRCFLMGLNTLAIGSMAKQMDWVKKPYLTELNMMVFGMMANLRLESAIIRMENSMKASGLMESLMERVSKLGQMEGNTTDSGM